jgi:hypothetical protein
MDLREARERTGLSEKTLRRLIKEGKLQAELIGSGPTHHWEVSEEALDGLGRKDAGHGTEYGSTESVPECPNCHWMREHLDAQLAEKDKQIEQLHVLLQRSLEHGQSALPAPQGRRWWWPWG